MSSCKCDERAEAGDLGDLALDEVADLEARVDVLPRIVVELLDAEADALVALVDIDDDRFDFVALLQHFGRMIDLAGPATCRRRGSCRRCLLRVRRRRRKRSGCGPCL